MKLFLILAEVYRVEDEFKAAQTGGPSGGCIPAAHLDVKMDYEALINLGSIMGSGGLIIMDNIQIWWMWPGSLWNSVWMKVAANVCPAGGYQNDA